MKTMYNLNVEMEEPNFTLKFNYCKMHLNDYKIVLLPFYCSQLCYPHTIKYGRTCLLFFLSL